MTAYISKLGNSWLFIGPSEHHNTTQTSEFNNFLNGASTMLNNVLKVSVTSPRKSVKSRKRRPCNRHVDTVTACHEIATSQSISRKLSYVALIGPAYTWMCDRGKKSGAMFPFINKYRCPDLRKKMFQCPYIYSDTCNLVVYHFTRVHLYTLVHLQFTPVRFYKWIAYHYVQKGYIHKKKLTFLT